VAPPRYNAFPTRRSSDLHARDAARRLAADCHGEARAGVRRVTPERATYLLAEYRAGIDAQLSLLRQLADVAREQREVTAAADFRSEEHTSELQSRENLVC